MTQQMERLFYYYICDENTQKLYKEIKEWITDNIYITDDDNVNMCMKRILTKNYNGYFVNGEFKMDLFEMYIKMFIYNKRCAIPARIDYFSYFTRVIIYFNTSSYNNDIHLPEYLYFITNEDAINIEKIHEIIYEQEENADYPILK
jgi:hypothetical protein